MRGQSLRHPNGNNRRPPASKPPCSIGAHLNHLVPDALHTLNLFDATGESQERTRLTKTMDALNNKYGLHTLAPASMLAAYRGARTRIAFHSIPDLF